MLLQFQLQPLVLKGGLNLNVVFLPLSMGLIETSRLGFKQYRHSMLIQLMRSCHSTILCLSVFCKFLGDFWVYLEGDSFSRRIGKIM